MYALLWEQCFFADSFTSSRTRKLYQTTILRHGTNPLYGPHQTFSSRECCIKSCFLRGEIDSITIDSMPHGVDATLLDELPRAILVIARLNCDSTVNSSSRPGASSSYNWDYCYAWLIFILATNDECHERLSSHGHLEWCISPVDAAQGLVTL